MNQFPRKRCEVTIINLHRRLTIFDDDLGHDILRPLDGQRRHDGQDGDEEHGSLGLRGRPHGDSVGGRGLRVSMSASRERGATQPTQHKHKNFTFNFNQPGQQ